jgi:carboxyl-terminal processing protease
MLAVAILVSLACYNVAAKNRHANLFAEAIELIERESLYPKPADELFVSAMNGMMKQLDDHSAFMYGSKFNDMENDIRQEFGGVGMYLEVDSASQKVFVLAPIPDTPAFAAGIMVGDVITKIDSTEVSGMTREQVTKLLRGPINKPVNITIARNGDLLEKRVVRAAINTPSIYGDFQSENGQWNYHLRDYPDIGYIRINLFGEKTVQELKRAIGELPPNLRGLIIDLRNNSGGLLDSAIEVCDLFLPPQQVIVGLQRRNDKTKFTYSSTPAMVSLDLPLVLLINRYSASASEVVAGCLQDHGRAIIVGEQSFGKATVQNVIPMQRGVSALKLTTASYCRPSGKRIDRHDEEFKESKLWGIQPDPGFAVPLTEKDVLNAVRDRSIRDLEGLVGSGNAELLETVRRLRQQLFDSVANELESDDTQPSPDHSHEGGIQNDENDKKVESYIDPTMQRAIEYFKSQAMNKVAA